jgi:hypothetical protein
MHEAFGDLAESLEVGSHVRRSQCAVKTNAERFAVRHGDVECLGGLAGQGAARSVGDRAGDDQRQTLVTGAIVEFLDRKQSSPGNKGTREEGDEGDKDSSTRKIDGMSAQLALNERASAAAAMDAHFCARH